jgi:hypothetical protein
MKTQPGIEPAESMTSDNLHDGLRRAETWKMPKRLILDAQGCVRSMGHQDGGLHHVLGKFKGAYM